MPLRLLSTLAVLWLGGLLALADESPRRSRPVDPKPSRVEKANASPLAPEREEFTLAFVREHHPELAALLESLKAMRPKEYQRAIGELYPVSRSLENLKLHNPRRYELGLELWKSKSKAELLAAKLVSTPSAELESQLRIALENQLELEIRQQQAEQEQLKARLNQVETTIKRLNDNREKLIESRLQGLRNKVQRARRLDAGKSAPSKPVRAKGGSKA